MADPIVIKPIQEITLPLALRDSGKVEEFNEAAERNLTELRQMTLDINNSFRIDVNAIAAQIDPLLQNATDIINVGKNINAVTSVSAKLPQIQGVYDNLTLIQNTYDNLSIITNVNNNMANILTVANNADNIQNVIDHMDDIIAAPEAAEEAQEASLQSYNSAGDSANAATNAEQQAASASASLSLVQSMQAEIATMYEDIKHIQGGLMDGATPEPNPESPMARDNQGRTQVQNPDPNNNLSVANVGWVNGRIQESLDSISDLLKIPVSIDTESTDLPPVSQAQAGDYYFIANMDVTAPGKNQSGRAWYSPTQDPNNWQKQLDKIAVPDGVYIVTDQNTGAITLSADVKTKLGHIDTNLSITQAIANAVNQNKWQGSAKFVSTTAPTSAVGANGDIYFQYV